MEKTTLTHMIWICPVVQLFWFDVLMCINVILEKFLLLLDTHIHLNYI